MKIKCAKCGKEFDKEVVTEVVNLCNECQTGSAEMPNFLNDLFRGFKK